MRDTAIPKEILCRLTFTSTKFDPTPHITQIVPVEPCPCGEPLTDTRIVRLSKNQEPVPHWREYCHTCRRVSILGENTWYDTRELNRKMRNQEIDLGK